MLEEGGDLVERPADGGEGVAGWEVWGSEHGFERGDYGAEAVGLDFGWWGLGLFGKSLGGRAGSWGLKR